MSTEYHKLEIVRLLEKTDLLNLFDSAYVFGSIVKCEGIPHDIDILLIYSIFSCDIHNQIDEIAKYIEERMLYPVDITALSIEEEKEVRFIDNLDNQYVRIK